MADINQLRDIVKKIEGGYVNHPNDRGGCTNMGITIATFRQQFGRNKTCRDLANMTPSQWNLIFHLHFWDKWKADSINNQSIANFLVDWSFHSGIWGIKLPQRILGVKDDGIVGPKTLAALNNYPDQGELFERLWKRRKQYLDDIIKRKPSQKVFRDGWYNRIAQFKYEESV